MIRDFLRFSLWLLGALLLAAATCAGGAVLLTQAQHFIFKDMVFMDEGDNVERTPVAVPAPLPAQQTAQRLREVRKLRSTWKGSPVIGKALDELQGALASCGTCELTRLETFPGMSEALNGLLQAGAWNELPVFSRLVDQVFNPAGKSLEALHALAVRQYFHTVGAAGGDRCGAGAQRLQFVAPSSGAGWAALRVADGSAGAQALIWVGDLNADGLPELITHDMALWSGCGGAAFKRVSLLPGSFRWFDHVGAEPGKGRGGWARLAGQVDRDERETVHLFDFDGSAYHHTGTRPWRDEDAMRLWGKSLDLPPAPRTDAP